MWEIINGPSYACLSVSVYQICMLLPIFDDLSLSILKHDVRFGQKNLIRNEYAKLYKPNVSIELCLYVIKKLKQHFSFFIESIVRFNIFTAQ